MKGIYIIYNILEEESSPPMIASSDTHAKRIFEMSMKNLPEHMNENEFSLYKIGDYNSKFPWDITSHAPIALVAGTLVKEDKE